MDVKLRNLIEGMVEEVSLLDARTENRVDEIWDRNYDNIVDLVVEVSCQERETCYEREVHDIVADLRTMFYDGAEGYSFTCEGCGQTFYGKSFDSHGREFCKSCRNSVEE